MPTEFIEIDPKIRFVKQRAERAPISRAACTRAWCRFSYLPPSYTYIYKCYICIYIYIYAYIYLNIRGVERYTVHVHQAQAPGPGAGPTTRCGFFYLGAGPASLLRPAPSLNERKKEEQQLD